MMTAALDHFRPSPAQRAGFDIGPITRIAVGAAAILMSSIVLYAVMRGIMGAAPDHYGLRNTAVLIHVVTVIPAVPLGGYLLLSRKGTKLHKLLGKLWISLMVVTAVAITFNRGGTDFSWIHIFVPITLHGSWKVISTARAGNIAAHKKHILGMYLGALMIPGAFSFLPGRLMGAWLFG